MRFILLIFFCAAAAMAAVAQSKGTYKPAAFPDEAVRLHNLRESFKVVDAIYRDYAKENHLPAIAYGIVADGKLIHSGAEGVINLETNVRATTQSAFRIASMTKSFTAMAIMKLQEDGKLKLSDAASRYVPEMRDYVHLTSDATPITIHHLLTMTAGFPEDNPWGDRQLEDTDEEFLAFLKNGITFSSTPGQQYEYSNLGYAILGNIVTRVSGMPYQQYITETILRPLGMHHTYWEFSAIDPQQLVLGYRWEDEQWKKEPMLHDGAFGAMGGLITSLEDFSKYVAWHLSAYPDRNEADSGPVKRSSLREMHKPYSPRLFADAKTAGGNSCAIMVGYGFGLGYRHDCEGVVRISHSGGLPGFGSEYRFYPDYGIGVISFANRTYAGMGSVNGRVLDTLVAIGKLQPRVLPVSDILNKRKEELVQIIRSRDKGVAEGIFAENFFLDQSYASRAAAAKEVFNKVGKLLSVGPMVAENQLRGYFILKAERGDVRIYFTLSPEKDPKIQQLNLSIEPQN